MFAGMRGMAFPAFPCADRRVLRGFGNVVMTVQTDAPFRGLQFDGVTLDLVTVVAVSASHRRMNDLLEHFAVVGTMLGVAVYAARFDRVVLVGRSESGIVRVMAGST
jgi:hypothetical protein